MLVPSAACHLSTVLLNFRHEQDLLCRLELGSGCLSRQLLARDQTMIYLLLKLGATLERFQVSQVGNLWGREAPRRLDTIRWKKIIRTASDSRLIFDNNVHSMGSREAIICSQNKFQSGPLYRFLCVDSYCLNIQKPHYSRGHASSCTSRHRSERAQLHWELRRSNTDSINNLVEISI